MAQRNFLSAKIHGATITCAKLEYHGSLSIDTTLLEAAGILPFERVDIYNLDNGERLSTYAIPGGPGEICMNGAAAHKGQVGQRIIIATYQWLDESEMTGAKPKVVITNTDNTIAEIINYELSNVP
ncbi:aspartate 1-decarboxylase [Salidesulfovibrio brasiliensis]|uniref:aspartate 1-decarboxylase n=1 Tax=Salidesulfovibrio brasiliensis TaxID=221711 RepID=UPI0006D1D5D6|nr:aspartate 1-decarboxylase [Salidesulfovibrio brasiliensis]